MPRHGRSARRDAIETLMKAQAGDTPQDRPRRGMRQGPGVKAAGPSYIPIIAMSFTVPLTPVIFAASVAFPVARSTL
jgi:hypothetical protein